MSHRTPLPPPSPALSPSLYSGMSSLQIDQAGPGPLSGSSYRPFASQPQKALLKGPKTARHQSRKSEHPSLSVPWKDPRQAAAVSSGHRRMMKDDASYRQIQTSWSPFPPDARASTRREDDVMVRTVTNHIRQTEVLANQLHEEKWGDAERRVSELEVHEAARQESEQIIADMRRERENYMSGELLELIATSPDEEIRQGYLKLLDSYRRRKRNDERRDELRYVARRC